MDPILTSSTVIDRPLGATWDGTGVDFCLFSRNAEGVEVEIFPSAEASAGRRVRLRRGEGDVWRVRIDGLGPGTFYGFRVTGRFAPQDGLLFNPSKLLIDPYARAVTGEPEADPSVFGYELDGDPAHSYDGRDSAHAMPKGVVVDPSFDWQGVEAPRVPWSETIVYETHVRGLTQLHPELAPELRGTYAGLVSEPLLDHFRRLGITAVELLPVFQSAPEAHLLFQGRSNYWGYSPVSFFAPNGRYARSAHGDQVREFKTMVRELHRAGLEVILDVVYNHTAEGGLRGPTYGFKGIDNPSYYRLRRGLPSRWLDYTGCGNTLDVSRPAVRALVLDSLRFWVTEMGVDGFRFDLATTLGRDGEDFDPRSTLFREIARDERLSRVKWIAEPWDLGPGGYRLGQFPAPWSEWNDRFRDTTRKFWRGDADGPLTGEFASRLAGSRDLVGQKNLGPRASLNYVVSHDGFTLEDWVSYEHKRNQANGEDNRDGTDNNLSRNWGHEGPTDQPVVRARRDRVRRSVMATLLFSQGVPMIGHGDEIGRTQRGNNNPYCQDNELAWTDWSRPDRDFFHAVRRLVSLRRRYPHLRRERFLEPDRAKSEDAPGALWLGVSGKELRTEDWDHPEHKSFLLMLPPLPEDPPETLLLAVHGGFEDVELGIRAPGPWRLLFDSANDLHEEGELAGREEEVELSGYGLRALSIALFAGSPRTSGGRP